MSNKLLEAYVAATKPMLRQHGFRVNSRLATKDDTENVLVVRPQASRANPGQLAINLEVYSRRLLHHEQLEPDEAIKRGTAHFHERLRGPVLGFGWEASSEAEVAATARAVADALEAALPSFLHLSNDVALRDAWLAGKLTGQTKLQGLTNLLTLVAAIGPRERFDEVAESLLKAVTMSAQEAVVRSHIERLRAAPLA